NYEPSASLPVLDFLDDRNALEMFRRIKQRTEHLVATLPSQYEYLTHVRSMKGRSADETLYVRGRMAYDQRAMAAMAAAAGSSSRISTAARPDKSTPPSPRRVGGRFCWAPARSGGAGDGGLAYAGLVMEATLLPSHPATATPSPSSRPLHSDTTWQD